MGNDYITDVQQWFQACPLWLQKTTCAHYEDKLTEQLWNDTIQESVSSNTGSSSQYTLPVFLAPSSKNTIKLLSISNCNNINALSPSHTLKFAENGLTIVYGDNGSGKSSYVRTLKALCKTRHKTGLLSNIYKENTGEPSATVTYKENDKERSLNWDANCDSFLSNVDIYDTSFGSIFVDNEATVTYQPPILDFFDILINLSTMFHEKLTQKINALNSNLPQFPNAYHNSNSYKWWESISHQTESCIIDLKCDFDSPKQDALSQLQQKLEIPSANAKKNKLSEELKQIETFCKKVTSIVEFYSENSIQAIKVLFEEYKNKQNLSEEVVKKVLNGNDLDGVGSEEWKNFWQIARTYSNLKAYPDILFPQYEEGARCVFCNQVLSEEAKNRLLTLEEYVKSKAEQEFIVAKQKLDDEKLKRAIPSLAELHGVFDINSPENEDILKNTTSLHTVLQAHGDALKNNNFDLLSSTPLDASSLNSLLLAKIKSFEERIKELDEEAKTEKRDEIQEQINELKANEWLNQQKDAILKEVERLQNINNYELIKSTASTTKISTKKSEIAETLVSSAFSKNFQDELGILSKDIAATLEKTRTVKGAIHHKIQLKEVKQLQSIKNVLSEGEQRVISLAAFLADAKANPVRSGLIFDDPISSLDINAEEAVAKRLVNLAKGSQVIIFTHRISFLVSLMEHAKKNNVSCQPIRVRKFGKTTGIVGDLPMLAQTPKAQLNTMKDSIAKAKKLPEANNFEEYDAEVKRLCSLFRELVELNIEKTLLNGVVSRFSRNIASLKIPSLAKIQKDEIGLIDNLMTKYSYDVHSQPDESPPIPVTLDELLKDVNSLLEFVAKVTARNN